MIAVSCYACIVTLTSQYISRLLFLTYNLVYLLSNLTIFNTSFLNSQLLDRRSFLLTVAEATHVWTEVLVRTWHVHVLQDSVEICVILFQVCKSIVTYIIVLLELIVFVK